LNVVGGTFAFTLKAHRDQRAALDLRQVKLV